MLTPRSAARSLCGWRDGVVTVWRIVVVGAIVLLGGCATPPVAPSVMALPGAGKTLEQFHAEDTDCRQWAIQRAQETAQSASPGQISQSGVRQQWYDMAYLQCMYTKGNRIPGVLSGSPPPPAAPAPPSPSLPAGAKPPPTKVP
jgi:hypothetical protein